MCMWGGGGFVLVTVGGCPWMSEEGTRFPGAEVTGY